MIKVVTAEQMGDIDRRCAEGGLPTRVLMENAGRAVAQEVRKAVGSAIGRRVVLLVGPGNNGGDGLVAARYLHDWGAKVHAYLYHRKMDGDDNLRLALERGIPCTDDLSSIEPLLPSADVVIDALFGTGKLRPLEGEAKEVLQRVRAVKEGHSQPLIVALDLPSGLDADSGAIDPTCLPADITVTMGFPKVGLFSFPGAEKVGRLTIADIGFPQSLAEDIPLELITPEGVASLLPRRPADANKGTFGRVLIAAGSLNYIGAAYLACQGAMRVGAGLVTLATPKSLQPILAAKLTEATYAPLPEAEPGIVHTEAAQVLLEWLKGYNILLLGCGLGQSPQAVEFIRSSLFSLPQGKPFVLDADGLNALAKTPEWWQRLKERGVLTPHPGEMSRLTGLAIPQIQGERIGVSREHAAKWQQTVVLKGAHTVISSPDGMTRLSPIANAGLASAGTGDVLSGAIAGLMAQGLSPFAAAVCGVYLHATAGELAKEELGDAGMLATDLLPKLPLVLKGLRNRGGK
jgi:NAD(P)H-hydrate epimerase